MSSILSISYGYPVITNILENISPNYNPNLYFLRYLGKNVTTANYRFRFDSQFVSQFEERKGRRRLDSNIERGHEAVIKFSIVASTECESWAVKLRDKEGTGRYGGVRSEGRGRNFHRDVDGFSLKFVEAVVVVVVVAFLASERKRK